jgi:hypothetical protein
VHKSSAAQLLQTNKTQTGEGTSRTTRTVRLLGFALCRESRRGQKREKLEQKIIKQGFARALHFKGKKKKTQEFEEPRKPRKVWNEYVESQFSEIP